MNQFINYQFKRNDDHEAEILIYEELKNPVWVIKNSLIKKLKSIWANLKDNDGGVPSLPENQYKGCKLKIADGTYWYCFNCYVLRMKDNIIDIKVDENNFFENELLRSLPDDLYKEINYFI